MVINIIYEQLQERMQTYLMDVYTDLRVFVYAIQLCTALKCYLIRIIIC